MKNKYLVTGATGFVGSNIVRALIKKGEKVTIITRDKKLNWRLRDIIKEFDVHQLDLVIDDLVPSLKKIRPDYIFHLAAYGVLPNEKNTKKMIDVNLKGAVNLINAASKNPFKLFVNTGTSVEYGVKNRKMRETDVLTPINDYGVTKAAATLYGQRMGIKEGLPIVNFRLFTPFGKYEDKTRLVPSVILSALRNEPIRVSVPTTVRDFVFIEDVVNAYLRVTKLSFEPGEIVNIGSGKQHSIEQIVSLILKITKSYSEVEWGSVKKQDRFIEPEKWEADISRAWQILKWEPKYSIEQGLEKTIKWYSKNQKLYE
ncbi:MAG: hypothetical protein A3J18_02540 [Candidatus Levybacteria bacterium RIFCSPLOWO2_02_FULL_40_18]|nr:MAG: dTDP-glucose 4,6-dehydratase [Candidatus Levybacteria bacterium GW2011_GWA2_36_13]KKQ00978.1 MAG: dTDP-glucose 4,6-dehydratase [Candidatus Levybacteria bacterium GW2011_GWB1_36_18]KKR17639.1 MAG: dTDP-glucose 4,6-dehydratase [Candidatus Levybacteria bacterium GW2011_GWA1_39_32]KKR73695.1 MAG: dTDP-glucose 4,6-dehydratase [Candidatus Levybacteria bacterium GW2011_GWC2_40_7]OGH20430.1 MAG: hypothetical protein A2695_01890 [Candidatus Levybacteria bacterium RIFCSPHIGHO2_01_FULL_40_83]OGH2